VIFKEYNVVNFISVGSSLKFCMVAEGKADLYYRHGPTMEWDTAAGQAILEAAGGRMYRGNTQEDIFTYNKKDLLNGSFLCLGF
jgi:3'(2'), 5'-bisphosphate nucleotidase